MEAVKAFFGFCLAVGIIVGLAWVGLWAYDKFAPNPARDLATLTVQAANEAHKAKVNAPRTPLQSVPVNEEAVQVQVLIDTNTCPIPARRTQSIHTLPLWEVLKKEHEANPQTSQISQIPDNTSLATKRKLMVKGPSFNNNKGMRGETYAVAIDNESKMLGADEPPSRLPFVSAGNTILPWQIKEVLVYNQNKEEVWAKIYVIK
jgi:hypothetical protein